MTTPNMAKSVSTSNGAFSFNVPARCSRATPITSSSDHAVSTRMATAGVW
jgi:hypothetical protein